MVFICWLCDAIVGKYIDLISYIKCGVCDVKTGNCGICLLVV